MVAGDIAALSRLVNARRRGLCAYPVASAVFLIVGARNVGLTNAVDSVAPPEMGRVLVLTRRALMASAVCPIVKARSAVMTIAAGNVVYALLAPVTRGRAAPRIASASSAATTAVEDSAASCWATANGTVRRASTTVRVA